MKKWYLNAITKHAEKGIEEVNARITKPEKARIVYNSYKREIDSLVYTAGSDELLTDNDFRDVYKYAACALEIMKGEAIK